MMMKKQLLYLLALAAFVLTSCLDVEKPGGDDNNPKETKTLLILNQGSFMGNNSTLAKYDLEDSSLDKDFFKTINNRGLGDTGNDMLRYGDKIYIVVNGSGTVEVINAKDGKSIKQIDFKNEDGQSKEPRYAAAYGGKVYVTSFDNTVSRIDTVSLTIDGSVTVGRNPEGIAIKNNKIYVANSGGLDYGNPDNTISVIDLNTFKEEKKIEVNPNPYMVFADSQGDIYVSTRDVFDVDFNFVSGGTFQRIKPGSEEVETISGIQPVGEFTIVNDKAYVIINDFMQSKVTVYDCLNEKVLTESFIADGTQMSTPFSISVDPASEDVFLTETDYTTPGKVFCFDKTGKLKYSINTVGINPYIIQFMN